MIQLIYKAKYNYANIHLPYMYMYVKMKVYSVKIHDI